MALIESEKNGGPYTKQEKDERQNEVQRLHFECGYSAVKIAGMINVNRNTVNEDIKYLYSKLTDEWNGYNLESWLMKQIHRLESQRSRLLEELDKKLEINDRKYFEKRLYELDNKITQIIMKTFTSKKNVSEQTELISDDVIEDVVQHLIKVNPTNFDHYSEKQITIEMIKYLKCDIIKANKIFMRMKQLGLSLCHRSGLGPEMPENLLPSYDFSKFSEMRDIKQN